MSRHAGMRRRAAAGATASNVLEVNVFRKIKPRVKYALGYLVNPPSVWPGFSLKPRAEDGGNEMVTREYA